jgi:hypothetical protein
MRICVWIGGVCSLLLCVVPRFECIQEQDTQHKTQQEGTQPTNSNTYAYRQDLHIQQQKQQQKIVVSSPKISTSDDNHIGRNI